MRELADLGARFRPISEWPAEHTKHRKESPFRASWSDTMERLATELRQIAAKGITVEIAIEESDLRLDGLPRVHAKGSHPGVILSFSSKVGPLRIACDRFLSWQDNIRAIALGLHDLRRLDRYGITKRGEQYRGWRALPENTADVEIRDRQHAAEILAGFAPFAPVEILTGRLTEAFRAAVRKTHPDFGGDAVRFNLVNEARKYLEANA